ncbi:MAG: type VI secretion system tip protein VgrG [Deltaproteobacteria bacterium]|jgi:type VI secretion system secreted protein VgrG|nr:type VI secretion system tip protein VgrG [Deltaproteobacteria bacterium]MBW2531486.1 type VI secretion system tip protein VgrG [Deltaproteobacteria bacterium]
MANTDLLNVRLESEDIEVDQIDVHTLEGREAISQPFRFDLEVVCRGDAPAIDDVVGASVCLVFERGDDEVRRLHGIILEAELLYDTEEEHSTWRFAVVPRICRMTLVETLDVFLDLSVPEIIEKKLGLFDLSGAGTDFDLSLAGTYPKREFVVQYKETDLNFISRLAEHLGIAYFFDHRGGDDKIVFADSAGRFEEISGDPLVWYHRRGEEAGVYALSTKRRLIPSMFVCRDYNYRTPTLELQADHQLSEGDAGGIVEYGGHFKTTEEAAELAKVRAQERLSARSVHHGTSADQRFSAGHVFELDGHPEVSGRLLLVEVVHHHQQPVATGLASGTERRYRNEFSAIDASLTYRPPRRAHIPRIYGVVTGLIETDLQGQVGKYAKIDEEGRYTVKFLFDTAAPGERKASRPVRRIQPMAGPHYGMHFPLRPGVEVLIVFVDGDPDRPLIVGAVPNPVTPTPVVAASSTKNRIKTESGILLEIEDGAGS